MITDTIGQPAPVSQPPTPDVARIQDAAQKLESSFIAEMLKSSGFGEITSFGGGVGEEQFASYLRSAVADQMAASGGVGLSEMLFESLMESANE